MRGAPYVVRNDNAGYAAAYNMTTGLTASSNTYFVALEDALGSTEGPVTMAKASLAETEKIPFEDRDGDVYLLKAQILDSLGRFEDAVDSLNIGFKRAPKRADLYFWAALFLIKHNRDQQALELLETATKIVPDDPDLLLTKATVLELRRKTEEADLLLKNIQLRWPEWGRSYLIRGIIQDIHRNPEEALRSAPSSRGRSPPATFRGRGAASPPPARQCRRTGSTGP